MTQSHHFPCRRLSLLSLGLLAAFGAQAQPDAQAPAAVATLDLVTVTGQAAGLRKALAAQEKAHHVLSVISADDIGALPDKNAAEALARMPGVSLQRDQGEGRYVVIRGLGPDLNSVSVNGSLVPAPESGRRGVALDTLPAGMVRSLEVSKTLTPDQDADSMGGSIAVKTLSAFDLPQAILNFGVGVTRDQLTSQSDTNAHLLWARRFGESQRLGVAVGLSTEKRRFGSDDVETGGAWTEGRLSGFELRDYLPARQRKAFSANLDYRPGDGESYYLRAFFSRFSDDEVRDRLTLGSVANSTATPGGLFAEGQVVSARAERRLRQRQYTQGIDSLNLGTEQRLAGWTLQGSIGLGRASEDTPESINDARFRQNNVAGISFTDSQRPLLAGPATLYSTSAYALNGITLQARWSDDKEHHARIDLERPLTWAGRAASIKFGFKKSQRDKRNDTEQWAYTSGSASSPNYWGAGAATLAAFAADRELDFPFGRIGAAIDPQRVRARVAGLARDPARLVRESALNDYRIGEDISAGYAQISHEVDDRLQLLAGLRREETRFEAHGQQVNPSNALSERNSERRSGHWLPGLHVRYELDASTSVRGAWWNSVVRANFGQLAPGISLASTTEASIGNPDLNPLRSRNLDLGIERILGREGVLSAYLFDKAIRDFAYTTNLAGSGAWASYTTATSFANGDSAHVRGIELAYSQPLRMLPGALSGLIVGVNATFTDSKAEVARFDKKTGAPRSRRIRLPGQANAVFNLMLAYEAGPLSARLALNQKSNYLLELGADILNAAQDRYVDRQRQMDLSASWQFDRRWSVVVEALNLNRERYYVYQGSQPFNVQNENYGRTFKLSVKASLF
ncbi:TonB-dependent receptor [Mitsuaria sp. WAJ17]|uniref:TonB-dependent receptor n=1 Tax=Mitsuaria sp. WAJ17 TaxID=2761452 RepID=UPI00160103E7|nr:TonB-dependent receptor [Mitsuaria sp. WAJ17]MBB2487854.1 TonB-dependent receptor [Mitsuaria sp. WAJ17]